jgi:hypothetical protein
MASRLYPGFGSGKGTYTGDFECRSFSSLGKADMELGDKIILPTSALKDILKLKLSLPLQFRVTSDRACVPPFPLPPRPAPLRLEGPARHTRPRPPPTHTPSSPLLPPSTHPHPLQRAPARCRAAARRQAGGQGHARCLCRCAAPRCRPGARL